MSEISATHDSSHDDQHEHHGSAATYWAVFVSLCLLTTLSFLTTADWWRLGVGTTRVLMMIVSCAKALLVIMFFMHLKWETNWKWVMTIPASIMALFLMLMLVPDIYFRTSHYEEDRLRRAAVKPPKEQSYNVRHTEQSRSSGESAH